MPTRFDILEEMNIPVWSTRNTLAIAAEGPLSPLAETVARCTQCTLSKSRTQTVFGSGNPNADIMIIGEAPGAEEDKHGLPFVGRAGQLLTAMLKAVGLDREDIYITNILKCRPPNNRDPMPSEVQACTAHLHQQISHIQPKVILALGRIAAHYLLETEASLGRLRGKPHAYSRKKIPLLVTYHPAYLLRNPAAKSKSYEDLLLLLRSVNKTDL